LYNKFGYTPRRHSNISTQYIQAIRIYSLHQKRFSEYTLINPVITSYRHGTHQNGQDGTLENVMTISYESCLYAGGSTRVARGFAQLHYDRSPSPLTPAGGGTNSILGPGGLVNALDEIISDGSNGKWGSSAFKLARAWQKNKNVNLVNLAQGELLQGFNNILRGGSVGAALNQTYIPYRGVGANSGTGFQSALNTQTVNAPGSVNSNGFNISAGASAVTGGVASALVGNPISTGSLSGVTTGLQNTITGGDLNKVVELTKTSTSQLAATSSSYYPTNSFTAAIQAANQKTKELASNENQKTLQESLGKSASFLQQNLQNVGTTFQTGTNQISQSASALANTPLNGLQFAATPQVASTTAVNNMTSSLLPPITNTSTPGVT
jgi:hypothetical protein